MKTKTSRLLLLATAFASGALQAEVKPNPLFTDGAVLQRGQNVPVWGTANDGEKVTVEFAKQTVTTTAQGGKWRVDLKPLEAGGPFTMEITGVNSVTVNNLLVGEVWVASGQSNMELAVKNPGASPEASSQFRFVSNEASFEECNPPEIQRVPRTRGGTPQGELPEDPHVHGRQDHFNTTTGRSEGKLGGMLA